MATTITMPATMPRYRFSLEDFELMHEAGIFNEDSPIELIQGEIVEMAAHGVAHVYCLAAIDDVVSDSIGRSLLKLVQSSIRLPDLSMPEPDLTLSIRRGRHALPAPPDILLVAEVSDSSLNYDRIVKLPLYAEMGIPEAWIFNVVSAQIERHTEPRQGRYNSIEVVGRDGQLSSTTVEGLSFAANDIFGLDE